MNAQFWFRVWLFSSFILLFVVVAILKRRDKGLYPETRPDGRLIFNAPKYRATVLVLMLLNFILMSAGFLWYLHSGFALNTRGRILSAFSWVTLFFSGGLLIFVVILTRVRARAVIDSSGVHFERGNKVIDRVDWTDAHDVRSVEGSIRIDGKNKTQLQFQIGTPGCDVVLMEVVKRVPVEAFASQGPEFHRWSILKARRIMAWVWIGLLASLSAWSTYKHGTSLSSAATLLVVMAVPFLLVWFTRNRNLDCGLKNDILEFRSHVGTKSVQLADLAYVAIRSGTQGELLMSPLLEFWFQDGSKQVLYASNVDIVSLLAQVRTRRAAMNLPLDMRVVRLS